MGQVIIRSKNLRRISYEEAEELAEGIRDLLPDSEVVVEGKNPEQGMYGITYFEVVVISLATQGGVIIGQQLLQEITRVGIEWARARFSRKQRGCPVYIPIYGPDGKLLKSVLIKNATDEPEVDRERRPERDNSVRL